MNNPINEMLETSMEKLRKMIDVNTVMGQPITTLDGTTVIPITRVKYSFAGGGSEFSGKHAGEGKPYGGGTGGTVSVTPVAFLICKDGSSRILPIPEPASSTADRIIELVPDVADKVWQYIQEKKAEKTEEI